MYDDVLYGCVIFGTGANRNLAEPYSLQATQVCELVRVALKKGHPFSVSRAIAVALKLLKKAMPGLKMVISYADTAQGHHGGIYQAGNWIYTGAAAEQASIVLKGVTIHKRVISSRYGHASVERLRREVDPMARWKRDAIKHTYVIGLDSGTHRRLQLRAKRYPKRAASIENDATVFQAVEGGATPTAALHTTTVGNGTEKVSAHA